MSYFSLAEDQSFASFLGCGKDCGCGPCRSGLSGLAEWYEKEEPDEQPTSTAPKTQAAAPDRPSPGPPTKVQGRPAARRRRRPAPPLGYYGLDESRVAVGPNSDYARLQDALSRGIRDPRQLSNILFFGRHPERSGVRIRAEEVGLINEWRQILQRMVLPSLQQMFGPANGVIPRLGSY